ncbi:MAG: family transcriptional regulator [Ilumatobacteraceae bacterium]|nr:family transcriptional regulator [Ilumatobacteraceae bacterium]
MTAHDAPPREPAVDPISLGLGRAIKSARQAADMSMRTLAANCGVSQPFLSEVERGMSTPSIATLYRIADALGIAPSKLLPASGPGDVHVVRADEGRRVPSSERADSAIGRVVFSDEARGVEVYEYVTHRGEDLDVWFRHLGEKILYLVAGRLAVELEHRPTVMLGPGDCVIHPGSIAHRWQVHGDEPVRLFLVIVRNDDER